MQYNYVMQLLRIVITTTTSNRDFVLVSFNPLQGVVQALLLMAGLHDFYSLGLAPPRYSAAPRNALAKARPHPRVLTTNAPYDDASRGWHAHVQRTHAITRQGRGLPPRQLHTPSEPRRPDTAVAPISPRSQLAEVHSSARREVEASMRSLRMETSLAQQPTAGRAAATPLPRSLAWCEGS